MHDATPISLASRSWSTSARRARRLAAWALTGTLVALLGSCKSSTDASTTPAGGSANPPISATIPPGYDNTLASGEASPTAPRDTSGIEESAPTSVLPANQPLCEAVSQNSRLFSGPEKGSDEAAYLTRFKETFNNFAEVAPVSIKPEIQAMNNVIQSMSSAADITKLDDPNFTANQERFATFVKDSCGFDLSG